MRLNVRLACPGLLVATMLLVGCAVMTPEQCKVADWGRVGHADGVRGEPRARLERYVEDCAQAGVQPHTQAYQQGWDAGIPRYCTAVNGWRAGVDGEFGKDAVCQGQSGHEAFAQYLQLGLEVYRTREEMRRKLERLAALRRWSDDALVDDDRTRLRFDMLETERALYWLQNLLARQEAQAPPP